MEIEIKIRDASKYTLDRFNAAWDFDSQKTKKRLLFSLVFGLLCISSEFIGDGYSSYSSSTSTLNGATQTTTYFKLYFFLGLGIAILYLTGIYFYRLSKQKKENLTKGQDAARKYAEGPNEIIIKIDDAGLKYNDYQLSQDIKWRIFSSYIIHKDFIFLVSYSHPLASVCIDKRLLSETEVSTLTTFIKARLAKKVYN